MGASPHYRHFGVRCALFRSSRAVANIPNSLVRRRSSSIQRRCLLQKSWTDQTFVAASVSSLSASKRSILASFPGCGGASFTRRSYERARSSVRAIPMAACAHAGDAALKLVEAGRELPGCINEKRLAAAILSLIETACRAWHKAPSSMTSIHKRGSPTCSLASPTAQSPGCLTRRLGRIGLYRHFARA